MKKTLFTLLAISALFSFNRSENSYVYLCNSAYATKYHRNKYCEGLKNCSRGTYKVELKTAQKKGYTLCGYEKKR